jgi:streptomycin 6-kinase
MRPTQLAATLAKAHAARTNMRLPGLFTMTGDRFKSLTVSSLTVPLTSPTLRQLGGKADALTASSRRVIDSRRVNGVSLHADLEPTNVLSSGSAWLIDPLGAFGSPSYDLAHYVVCKEPAGSAMRTLNLMAGAYEKAGGKVDRVDLHAWFDWLVAFRWRISCIYVPADVERLSALLDSR